MPGRKRASFQDIVASFEGCRIAVIGDLILDEFVWGVVDRISPEAPVPVVQVHRESIRLGGAANVAATLRVLGAEPVLVGLLGRDRAASQFRRQLGRERVADTGIVDRQEYCTTIKTRIIAHQQQVCRTDREHKEPLAAALLNELTEKALAAVESCNATVLSDYAKGVVSPEISRAVIEACRAKGSFVAVDPKVSRFENYRRASILTPNRKEAELASGEGISDQRSLRNAGAVLLETTEAEALLITLGEEGMELYSEGVWTHLATVSREVFDVTGAGDTVIATLALAVGVGADLRTAAELANHAAGVVVGKVGTATCSPQELLDSLTAR